jgi:hypothetical protein
MLVAFMEKDNTRANAWTSEPVTDTKNGGNCDIR